MKNMSNYKTLLKCSLILLTAMFLYSCYDSEPLKKNKTELTEAEIAKIKSKHLYGFYLDTVMVNYDTIKKNQSLSEALSQYNVSPLQINELVAKAKGIWDVRKIRPNHAYQFLNKKDSAQTPLCFVYHISKLEYARVDFRDSIQVRVIQNKIDTIRKTLSGVINGSLYQTIVDQGGSPALAGMLAEVYAWQIDFFGIQKGDKFRAVYDQLEINGEIVGVNKIYATDFTHAGENFDAYWYEKDKIKGYYTSNAESLKKNFLKAPLEFKRISSTFSYRRLHPVHKVYRPHLGIDYAAPMGTPVVALGDGKVTKLGYSGGAGHMIKIKHDNIYETAYLHLSRYAKGVKKGSSVKQGQVIGYVGSTGWSTGPHLDFRVWKNGKNIDPLSLKPSKNHSLTKEQKVDFDTQKNLLFAELNKIK